MLAGLYKKRMNCLDKSIEGENENLKALLYNDPI